MSQWFLLTIGGGEPPTFEIWPEPTDDDPTEVISTTEIFAIIKWALTHGWLEERKRSFLSE